MPTTRSYADSCAIARALDVVGERWALLVIRELLLGPRRFADLRRALPAAASNLVADRLRELTARGVVRRLPTGSGYELTAWGRELEPVFLALGDWGAGVPQPDPPTTLSAVSVLLYLRRAAHPTRGRAATYRLDLDGTTWTVRTAPPTITVTPGAPTAATASLRTSPKTLNDLLAAPSTLDSVLRSGDATMSGDRNALDRLLASVG